MRGRALQCFTRARLTWLVPASETRRDGFKPRHATPVDVALLISSCWQLYRLLLGNWYRWPVGSCDDLGLRNYRQNRAILVSWNCKFVELLLNILSAVRRITDSNIREFVELLLNILRVICRIIIY